MIGSILRRNITTSAIRRLHVDQEGKAGANLPFQIANKARLTLTMGLYVTLAFSIPFIGVRHQLKKGGG